MMAGRIPESTRALVIKKCSAGAKFVYHDAVLETRPLQQLKQGEILVKMGAVSFNHRDLWIRLGQYPGIKFGSTLGADGAGTVLASADANDTLLNKRVFLTPMRGWESNPDTPEAGWVTVERNQVILSAWPPWWPDCLGAAAIVNAGASKDQNTFLITGIGGGVALLAMQLCLAKAALTLAWRHYDTNDSILKQGGKVVVYGMTVKSSNEVSHMREVIKNQRLIGSSMGSYKDLTDATKFVSEHRIVPVVSHVLEGFEAAEEGFELMKRGDQFGKIVIRINDKVDAKL
ncbi:hypothetical protein DFH29DRAFT_950106 [Suillus ampliporus]|nr:hypothetical protein DFH29DRAFT_950106 [Suillus ampliporus]